MTTKITCNDEGLYVESHLSPATPKKWPPYSFNPFILFALVYYIPRSGVNFFCVV